MADINGLSYRALLVKYMQHVLCEEGIHFLEYTQPGDQGDIYLYQDELKILKQLAREAKATLHETRRELAEQCISA